MHSAHAWVVVDSIRTKLPESPPGVRPNAMGSDVVKSWLPWIFAAKTTVSALLALLIAFTFNLDEPKWALITVFIVAQPQSGLVLAKSFYRVIGTLVGAAVALSLVSLFDQEQVLFLGALALWMGLCTFASRHAKNFAAYGFVLSGYTAAIVGVPAALHPETAFYIAIARVTEVGLGIFLIAAVSHLLLPASLSAALRRAISAARIGLADYGVSILNGREARSARAKLLGDARTIKNLSASAIFEDREIRRQSGAVQRLNAAFMDVINLGELLGWELERLRAPLGWRDSKFEEATVRATAAIADWRAGAIDASDLGKRLIQARSRLPRGRELCRDVTKGDAEVIHGFSACARLRDFLVAFASYAHAIEAFNSGREPSSRSVGSSISTDVVGAAWAGLRAALALGLVATFWILADWPSGPTAVILAGIVAALFATMENAGKAALAATFIVAFVTAPAFILIDVLLPQAQGFDMLALLVAPVLFVCAFLMGNNKSPLACIAGLLCALYFASVGAFEDRATYDAIGFINTSIAIIFAIAVAALLFAIVAPETPEAARRELTRRSRQAFARIADPRRRPRLSEFDKAITDALGEFKAEGAEDIAVREATIALVGAGRAFIRLRGDKWPGQRVANIDLGVLAGREDLEGINRLQRQVQTWTTQAVADLRDDAVSAVAARAAEREIVTLSAVGDAIERGRAQRRNGNAK